MSFSQPDDFREFLAREAEADEAIVYGDPEPRTASEDGRNSARRSRSWLRRGALLGMERSRPGVSDAECSSQAEAAAWPRCLAAEARVDCSHVSRAPTRTHPLRVGRGACDPLGVRSSRRGSGCGGVRRVPRVHCGLHRRVAPQGRRRSSQRRPVRPRRLVRGLVLDRRVGSLLQRGGGGSAGPATRSSAVGHKRQRGCADRAEPTHGWMHG